MLRNQHRQTTE